MKNKSFGTLATALRRKTQPSPKKRHRRHHSGKCFQIRESIASFNPKPLTGPTTEIVNKNLVSGEIPSLTFAVSFWEWNMAGKRPLRFFFVIQATLLVRSLSFSSCVPWSTY